MKSRYKLSDKVRKQRIRDEYVFGAFLEELKAYHTDEYLTAEVVKVVREIVTEATKELEEENKHAKEIIKELLKYVSDSKWYVQNGFVELQKELVAKAEAIPKCHISQSMRI